MITDRLRRLQSTIVTEPSPNRIDLTGKTLAGYDVIEYVYTFEHRAYWAVVCHYCGRSAILCGRQLRNGSARKCPCQYKHDPEHLVGQPFGRGTVIARAGVDEHNNALWLLQCSCPDQTEYTARTGDLTSNKTTSCGCVRREKVAAANKTRRRLDALYAE